MPNANRSPSPPQYDIAILVGVVCILIGVATISRAAGLIALGIAIICLTVLAILGRQRPPQGGS